MRGPEALGRGRNRLPIAANWRSRGRSLCVGSHRESARVLGSIRAHARVPGAVATRMPELSFNRSASSRAVRGTKLGPLCEAATGGCQGGRRAVHAPPAPAARGPVGASRRDLRRLPWAQDRRRLGEDFGLQIGYSHDGPRPAGNVGRDPQRRHATGLGSWCSMATHRCGSTTPPPPLELKRRAGDNDRAPQPGPLVLVRRRL